MALAQRCGLDQRAVRTLQDLRNRRGSDPVPLRVAGRDLALLLATDDVQEILVRDAENYTPANAEKRAALRHFQPHGSLISRGADRRQRRAHNEHALESDRQLHHLVEPVQQTAEREAGELGQLAATTGTLTWQDFSAMWWRVVRTVVLGGAARHDTQLNQLLDGLREQGNWAFAARGQKQRFAAFQRRLREHVRHADPTSITGADDDSDDLAEQVPHWLFAFDAAGMVTYRALALLAAHPGEAQLVDQELARSTDLMPRLRGAVLESVRLWPTTPVLLRDSLRDTNWRGLTLPAGTGFIAFTPYLHRDDTIAPHAHAFTPQLWTEGSGDQWPGLVPFSAGPGRCPGENVVLLVATAMLSVLLRRCRFDVREAPLHPQRPLPMTLDNFGLRFDVRTR